MLSEYSYFEIQHRPYSSNVIVGVREMTNAKGNKTFDRDIVVCPSLHKKEGDRYARFICDALNRRDSISILEDLVKKGFIGEIMSDHWANWEFDSEGKPMHDTAVPLYKNKDKFDHVRSVAWRGCFWYFDKSGQLVSDDIGCFGEENGGIRQALLELIKTYEELRHDIDPEGFNNPHSK